ncbi:hypothetical protein MNBD_PLANCTO03-465 [hydrothermal vent metagenome]|uniref:Uncharacterized protein n=1 Tax=hydrothermal vent metagenome TaxID=652676 RepID=A0A3B1DPD2_9ZZZZ
MFWQPMFKICHAAFRFYRETFQTRRQMKPTRPKQDLTSPLAAQRPGLNAEGQRGRRAREGLEERLNAEDAEGNAEKRRKAQRQFDHGEHGETRRKGREEIQVARLSEP